MKSVLALFLVFVIAVKSQVPPKCVAPNELEARIIHVGRERGREVRSRLSYDANNLRKRYVDVFTYDDKREYFDVLYLHNVGKEYRVDLKTKKCEARTISYDQFYPIGVPKNATFYGEANIGTKGNPGEGVLVQTWGGETERGEGGVIGKEYRLNLKTKECVVTSHSSCAFRRIGIPPNATFHGKAIVGRVGLPGEGVTVQLWGARKQFGGHYSGVWTLKGCLPVKESYYSNHTGYISTEYYDITLGISDPNVFIPPKECTGV